MSTDAPPRSSPGSSVWLASAGALVAVVALFAHSFLALVKRWDDDPNYSHGYLVLPISLVLAGLALYRLGLPDKSELGTGLLYVASGVVIHFVAILVSWPLLDFVGLAAVLRGVALAAGGRPYAAAITFPVLFLVFMFPWPASLMLHSALWLQEGVAAVSAVVLDLFVVCYRQGTSLHIAGVKTPIVVAEECSGLRQIVAFLALGALLGKFSGRSVTFRLLLLALTVPVAILANVLRVLLMAGGAVRYGTDWMSSWLHHTPAAFSLPVGVGLILLLMWCMEKLWPSPAEKATPSPTTPAEEPCP